MRHFNDMRPNKNETKQYITTKYKPHMAYMTYMALFKSATASRCGLRKNQCKFMWSSEIVISNIIIVLVSYKIFCNDKKYYNVFLFFVCKLQIIFYYKFWTKRKLYSFYIIMYFFIISKPRFWGSKFGPMFDYLDLE